MDPAVKKTRKSAGGALKRRGMKREQGQLTSVRWVGRPWFAINWPGGIPNGTRSTPAGPQCVRWGGDAHGAWRTFLVLVMRRQVTDRLASKRGYSRFQRDILWSPGMSLAVVDPQLAIEQIDSHPGPVAREVRGGQGTSMLTRLPLPNWWRAACMRSGRTCVPFRIGPLCTGGRRHRLFSRFSWGDAKGPDVSFKRCVGRSTSGGRRHKLSTPPEGSSSLWPIRATAIWAAAAAIAFPGNATMAKANGQLGIFAKIVRPEYP